MNQAWSQLDLLERVRALNLFSCDGERVAVAGLTFCVLVGLPLGTE